MTDDERKSRFEALLQENAAAHVETRRQFAVALEAINHEIRLLAGGVTQMREDLAFAATGLGETIERTAAETQAMIKSIHAKP